MPNLEELLLTSVGSVFDTTKVLFAGISEEPVSLEVKKVEMPSSMERLVRFRILYFGVHVDDCSARVVKDRVAWSRGAS